MKLFIDDIRNPSDVGYNDDDFVVARTFIDAMKLIVNCKPQFISFDHDLGPHPEPTGYDIAKEIVLHDMATTVDCLISENFKFNVHSANPVGAKNIQEYLDQYIKLKFDNSE